MSFSNQSRRYGNQALFDWPCIWLELFFLMIGLRKNERDGRFWVVDFYQFLLDVAQILILTILFAYEIIFFNIPKT